MSQAIDDITLCVVRDFDFFFLLIISVNLSLCFFLLVLELRWILMLEMHYDWAIFEFHRNGANWEVNLCSLLYVCCKQTTSF